MLHILQNSVAGANSCSAVETRDHFTNGASPKSQTSRRNIKRIDEFNKFLLLIIFAIIMLFQSPLLNAQEEMVIYASVGRSGEREMYMQGYDAFTSKNTICVDIGLGSNYKITNGFGVGIIGGLGIKSFELSTLSDALQGARRKGNWELSIGPALYINAFRSRVGLVLSAQPSYNIAKLLSAEDDVIVGSWGVKLSADIRLWYFTFGIGYNPFDVKLYKNNTNTDSYGAYNGKIIYARPALELRIGVIIGDWGGWVDNLLD